MSILTPDSFDGGEQNVPNLSNIGVRESLQDAIDKYEKRFLKELLGDDLAKQFTDGLADDPIEQKWIDLRDNTDLKEMLLYYVWFYYTNYQITFNSGTSEVKAKNENSTPASSYPKMVYAWNQMVELTRSFNLDSNIYPDWIYALNKPYWPFYEFWYYGCGHSEIFFTKNRYGL